VRKPATMVILSLLGCSHLDRSYAGSSSDFVVVGGVTVGPAFPGDLTRYDPAVSPIEALWVAGAAGVKNATSVAEVGALCRDGDTDPPYTCPGTTPASGSPGPASTGPISSPPGPPD
jgi:hypothetical protein